MTADPEVGSAAEALDGGVTGLRAAYRRGLDPVAVVDEVLARIDRSEDPAVWIDVEPAASLRAAAKALARMICPVDTGSTIIVLTVPSMRSR